MFVWKPGKQVAKRAVLTDAISTEKRASSQLSIYGEKPTCQA
jgi:hypothetical protein